MLPKEMLPTFVLEAIILEQPDYLLFFLLPVVWCSES